ncbi:rRNA pseudouridine synthase [candidate division KSB1 bacterium]|nr:rRNA pseudouridine synthase [candidate division KSB1 bacterium]
MRLNKYLASCGIASRRASEKIVQAGRVKLNGKPVTDLGVQVNELKDIISVNGKIVKPVLKKIYIILNKPKGYVTTAKDERGRKTVLDLLNSDKRVFPIGRLDIKTEGLLILTNDGELAHRLMHPGFKVNKTYRVKLDRVFNPDDFAAFAEGIEMEENVVSAPCKAGFYTKSLDRIEVKLHEGKKNQVRLMFKALGYEVKALKRVQYGPLILRNLDRGHWRNLTMSEIKQLKQAAGLSPNR